MVLLIKGSTIDDIKMTLAFQTFVLNALWM